MCAALWLAHHLIHQMAIGIFQIVYQHGTPTNRCRCTLKPSNIMIHKECLDVPIVVIITQTHRYCPCILVPLHLVPTIRTHRYGTRRLSLISSGTNAPPHASNSTATLFDSGFCDTTNQSRHSHVRERHRVRIRASFSFSGLQPAATYQKGVAHSSPSS